MLSGICESAPFSDKRSKQVILVAHCILNQNAKLDRCAHHPGAIEDVVCEIMHRGLGIIQLPCPEVACIGLDRSAPPYPVPPQNIVAAEDSRIAKVMCGVACMKKCSELAQSVVNEVKEYRKHGFQVVGLVGVNGSPTCGIETSWSDDQEIQGNGIFMKLLTEKLKEDKCAPIPMVGIKAKDTSLAVKAVKALCSN